MKIIAEAKTGKLLGMHILGAHATDMIHEGAVLLTEGAKAEVLAGRTGPLLDGWCP